MMYVYLTLSFAVGSLLSGFIALAIVMNPKVMSWYYKKLMKMTIKMMKDNQNLLEEMEDVL